MKNRLRELYFFAVKGYSVSLYQHPVREPLLKMIGA